MMQQLIQSGGVQIVTTPKPQLIYLDFDGETTSYNGEALTIDEVIVNDSDLSQTQINSIVNELNTQYAGQNVLFVTERPTSGDYSTVFIGKTSAFDYTGLAETVDKGNLNPNDNAFVNLDASSSLDKIIATISHEVDHLLGTLDHGGEGLAAYQDNGILEVGSGQSVSGVNIGTGRTYSEMFIDSGGIANNTTVFEGGVQDIYDGIANNTVISSGGKVLLDSYGSAVNLVWTPFTGYFYNYGGYVTFANTLSGCYYGSDQTIYSNMLMLNFQTLSNNTSMYVMNGGVASNTIINGGYQEIFSGGYASGTTLNNGSQVVNMGGIISNTVIQSGALLSVTSGGSALSITQLQGGMLKTKVIGADSKTVISGTNTAGSFLLSGGVANNFVLYGHDWQDIYSGGVANNTVISGGGQYVSSGGVANNTSVFNGGEQIVSFGGMASSTVVSGVDGLAVMILDGKAINTYLKGGDQDIYSGGVATSTRIDSGSIQNISKGGIAVQTDIINGQQKLRGGTAVNTTIRNGATQKISSGGIARDTVVSSGGSMYISSGGSHAGTLNIQNGAMVSAYTGANIDFSAADQKTTDNALISNLDLIIGHADANYSITISANQATGNYKLASGAASYVHTATVKNTAGAELGILSVGSSLTNGSYMYKLTLSSGNLNLAVESITEVIPRTNLLDNGYSQIVAWDAARGKVGYVAADGQVAPSWHGIWEWSGAEASMWKVVGVGQFSNSVEHDGILLYNGYGNTFAAWTDLGRGDYGYVSLCHVEGNFQTKTLADFDGNGLDDVIIYDEKGSFGIVSDARTYHDVWHVDNAATNVQKLIGAGYFGNADGMSEILVKKTDENAYFLWHNEDPTFNTWNWSQTYIGSLGNDWEVAAIGDFQGDGIDDIIMWQKSTGYIYAWEDGKSSNQRWVGQLDSNKWEIAAVGDYNGDGKEDLLLRELSSGWGGVGYWASANASNWTDLNARIETDMESKFAVIA